jgi:hypothetical protein
VGVGWPYPGRCRRSAPPWSLPLVSWWRGKGTPTLLYKGGPRRRCIHKTSTSLGALPPTWCAAHLHLSFISLSRDLPKGCVGARLHHRFMSLCCGVSESCPKPSTSANFDWIRDSGGHRYHHTCVSTWRCCTCGAGVVAPSSSTTLRSATSTSSASLVWEC